MNNQLWQKITAARKNAELSRDQLGKVCGVSRAAVGFWESANPKTRHMPNIKTINKVAETTDVPSLWLLDANIHLADEWANLGRNTRLPSTPLIASCTTISPSLGAVSYTHILIESVIKQHIQDQYDAMPFAEQIQTVIKLNELLEDNVLQGVIHTMKPNTLRKMLNIPTM